jgi:hypothetical protein
VPGAYIHCLVAGRGVVLPLGDDHGLEVLALGHLGLDFLDEALEVGSVLGMLAGGGIAGWGIRGSAPARAWSTPPWAEAGGTWTAVGD